jgi:hypothetical protein
VVVATYAPSGRSSMKRIHTLAVASLALALTACKDDDDADDDAATDDAVDDAADDSSGGEAWAS